MRECIVNVCRVQPVKEAEKLPEDLNPCIGMAMIHRPILAYLNRRLGRPYGEVPEVRGSFSVRPPAEPDVPVSRHPALW
jgi:hypothetical protein